MTDTLHSVGGTLTQSTIKLLCIVPNTYMGGLQFMTLRLFANLSSKIDPLFLLTRWTDGEFAKHLDEFRIGYQYSWFGMFSRRLDRRNLQMTWGCLSKLPTLYKDYLQVIRHYQPDAIYFASYHEIILLLPLLMMMRIPVIYHVHHPLPTGQFYQSNFALWGRAVTHFIAVSSEVRENIIKLGIEANSVTLLLNKIDLEKFPYSLQRSSTLAQMFSWPSESIIVGMTGQMFEHKGHLDFINAAEIVHKQHDQTRFIIGGKINQPYYEVLRSSIATLGLSKMIAFSGWETDMSKFYQNLDIFVLPSSGDEGLPLVILEAMATGLPVIASKSGGVTDVIDEGQTGMLVERKSPLQLASAMSLLVSSHDLRLQMGIKARQRIEEDFSIDQQAVRFEEILMNTVRARHD